jgi:serine/threonine-protein kinase
VRVLARPWAEVSVDGKVVDTTPMARPIVLPPGRHFLTFRHPQAPDEERPVDVLPDQGTWLDVTMQVVTRAPAVAPSTAPSAPESP